MSIGPLRGTGPTTEAQLRRRYEQQQYQLDLARQQRRNQEQGIVNANQRAGAGVDAAGMQLRLAQMQQQMKEAAAYNQIARLNAGLDVTRATEQNKQQMQQMMRTEVPSAYMSARRLLGY